MQHFALAGTVTLASASAITEYPSIFFINSSWSKTERTKKGSGTPPRDYLNSKNRWRERCIIRHIYCQSVGRAVRITLTGISTAGRPDPDPPPDRGPLPRRCDDSAGSWLASWNPALGIGGDSVLLATSTLPHFWGASGVAHDVPPFYPARKHALVDRWSLCKIAASALSQMLRGLPLQFGRASASGSK